MIRILLFSMALMCVSQIGHSQTEQGRWMISGVLDTDLSLDDDDDASFFLLEAGLSKFVLNRLALGGNVGIDRSETGLGAVTNFTIGPVARWYILGGGNLQMFLQTEVDLIYQRVKPDFGDSSSDTGFGFFGAPGLSYFFTDNVSIDIQMGYNYRTFGEDATSENIRLLAGFQIFL